jgi:hypothetical protein
LPDDPTLAETANNSMVFSGDVLGLATTLTIQSLTGLADGDIDTFTGTVVYGSSPSGWTAAFTETTATSRRFTAVLTTAGSADDAVETWTVKAVSEGTSIQPPGHSSLYAVRVEADAATLEGLQAEVDGETYDVLQYPEDGEYYLAASAPRIFMAPTYTMVAASGAGAGAATGSQPTVTTVSLKKQGRSLASKRARAPKWRKIKIVVTVRTKPDWQSKVMRGAARWLDAWGAREHVSIEGLDEMVDKVKAEVGTPDRTGQNGNCISHLSIYSHGYVGSVQIYNPDKFPGALQISLETLHGRKPGKAKLAELKDYMWTDGWLNLEACSVALGKRGMSFLGNLADLLDVKVFAITGEHLGIKRFGEQRVVSPGDNIDKAFYDLDDFREEVYEANKTLIDYYVNGFPWPDSQYTGPPLASEYKKWIIGSKEGWDRYSAVDIAWRMGRLEGYTLYFRRWNH